MTGFTLEAWIRLLGELRAHGYTIVDYAGAAPDARQLVLRHDVDFSLDAALAMARAEAAAGIRSTYFVMVRSAFYNVAEPTAAAALAELRRLGHTIGLHLDASLYAGAAALEAGAHRECRTLEAWSDGPVETISFHRPAPHLLEAPPERIAGRLHAYAPRFFREIGYCSDSRGGWHYGHPLDHPAVAEGRALQLLTHPIWWTGDGSEPPAARVVRVLADLARHLDEEAARNCAPYAEWRGWRGDDG